MVDSKSTGEIIYLALGSNLGEREENLAKALVELGSQVTIKNRSSVYETPPWGVLEQPVFYNQVIQASTLLTASDLLKFVKEIEQKMGRKKTVRYGPRLIDIDILLYGNEIINLPDLIIPHPQMCSRGFVLVPLAEINPNLVIPGRGQTVDSLLSAIDVSGIVRIQNQEL